ncbi:Sodium/calcium exchanger protein-domain-containing protein [Aspergillus ambiguus]|uniref:sodium:calcium antiporter n=1 Tax=Aspergillus ambiguus TaxID=176160 RepID=UPI003CCD38F6
MGSTISNILGAFSLGMLVHPGRMQFDRSARSYTAILLGLTTMSAGLTWAGRLNRITGGFLIATFVIYLISIGFAIYRGVVSAPELSDSESDSDSDTDDVEANVHRVSETSHLLQRHQPYDIDRQYPISVARHVLQLLIGLVCLSVSGYILAQSASAIAESLGLSGTVVGFTVLSIVTTIPEKVIALVSGVRGHSGIMVANTAGSNIFLLTLCAGVIALSGELGHTMSDYMTMFELVSVWVSSALLACVVFLDLGRWMGAVLLFAYAAFLVCEFTVYRR